MEAKNLCVLISLTYHCTDRDRKSTQQIQCVDSLLTCIKGSKEDVISVFYYTPIFTQSDCNQPFSEPILSFREASEAGTFFFISVRIAYCSVDLYPGAGGITWGQLEALPFNKQRANATHHCVVCCENTTCYFDFHKRADAFVKNVLCSWRWQKPGWYEKHWFIR